jgi:hypothetical protein
VASLPGPKNPADASDCADETLIGVRRTVFMAYVLNLSLASYKNGYCANWLFMESLPFDARPGLWMAESAQAWMTAVHAKFGEEVGERLNSYHEFSETFRGRMLHFCGDLFLTLVVVAHNGHNGAGTEHSCPQINNS